MRKKLIDKSEIVSEIEKLQKVYSTLSTHNNYEDGLKEGRLIGYKDALHKINTLEVKEVDLEKEVDLLIKSSTWAMANREDFLRVAKHFFELGIKSKGE